MRSCFYIHTTSKSRIDTVSKVVIRLMFHVVRSALHEVVTFVLCLYGCNSLKTSCGGSNKLQDIGFENTKIFKILSVRV